MPSPEKLQLQKEIPAAKPELPEFISYSEKYKPTPEETKKLMRRYSAKFHLSHDIALTLINYLLKLDLTPDEVLEKTTIDIGAGSGKFKEAMEKITGRKLNNIVELDKHRNPWWSQSTGVQAKAEELPFKDESFDLLLANCSVPIMPATGHKPRLIPQIIREAVRVLKNGGVAKIYPLPPFGSPPPMRNKTTTKKERRFYAMRPLIIEELKKIHESNPDITAKLTKFIDRNRPEYSRQLLEIQK